MEITCPTKFYRQRVFFVDPSEKDVELKVGPQQGDTLHFTVPALWCRYDSENLISSAILAFIKVRPYNLQLGDITFYCLYSGKLVTSS